MRPEPPPNTNEPRREATLHGPSMPFTLSSRTHGRSTTEPQNVIPGPARRSWLSRLLAGELALPPFAPCPARPHAEAATLSRLLGCPDLFVLDCPDSAARERHFLNLARAAAERGERLLIVTPDPTVADRLVEALAPDRALRVIRALADDENPVRPSPAVSRLTATHAGATRAEQLRREAAQTASRLATRLSNFERGAECHAKLESIEAERREAIERRSRIEAEVRANPGAPPTRCREIQSERESIRLRRAELERMPATKSGILSRLFGLGKTAPAPDAALELKSLAERDAALAAECEAESSRGIADEIASRQESLNRRLAELEADAKRIDVILRELHPQAASEDTIENSSPSRATRAELERELAVARTRDEELAAAGADLPRRLLLETQIVVGTPGSVDSDPIFAALGERPFERLVLDRAEELNDAAFDCFTPLASRWILAGDASPPATPIANGRPRRAPEPTLLHRLALRLDREPWRIVGNRLVVRLVPLADRGHAPLVREPLLDHPDVELGMATVNGEPLLAEIAFPAAMPIHTAKSFLFTQLGEVALRTLGEPEWSTGETEHVATWPPFDGVNGEWIELESGIRERVAGHGPLAYTGAIAFDTAIWDESAAREWLAARIAPHLSRVAVLPCIRTANPIFAR